MNYIFRTEVKYREAIRLDGKKKFRVFVGGRSGEKVSLVEERFRQMEIELASKGWSDERIAEELQPAFEVYRTMSYALMYAQVLDGKYGG